MKFNKKGYKVFLDKIAVLFIFFMSLNFYAQRDVTYVNEHNENISKAVFYNKIKTLPFYGLRYSVDTLVLQKVKMAYYFGTLTNETKSQLFQLFAKRHQIDTTKALIIHYSDTLKSVKEFPKRNSVVFRDSLDNIIKIKKGPSTSIDFSKIRNVKKYEYFWSYKSFIKNQKKCIRNHKKYEDLAQVLHFYNQNTGHPDKLDKLQWYKDYGSVIKKTFIAGDDDFSFIIIHPNGDFYVQNKYLEFYYPYKNLVKKVDWEIYKSEFLEAIKI